MFLIPLIVTDVQHFPLLHMNMVVEEFISAALNIVQVKIHAVNNTYCLSSEANDWKQAAARKICECTACLAEFEQQEAELIIPMINSRIAQK